MPIRICYNASRQKDTSVQGSIVKNPGSEDSGIFLFASMSMAGAMERFILINK